ncbi:MULTISPECIES: tyrosine-type recombinase/integrase [Cupriavidus]|uniref:Integrase/recombinase n=3 Tax=Cupriavidus TaxID=106589 RepID=A0A375FAV5_9BURK|nr:MULTISPECIES: tyrosine-type recombinase/integrase [Cupriavidus]MCO4865632.1 tyrosine-type recombinase/integrase [Cupriavidus sp. WGlv3]MCO4893352.1 tyrosine-type recombinase/integrase [Cupriavidus sp. WGtm5]ULX55949.1 integrase [Cupriavidus taiwanensis]CAP64240.1 integrase/recombinase [Cupriavidus taiwanensis LMG 19424]SOY76563.1 integrase/recombinase [Cupriavidus taiwanensis]
MELLPLPPSDGPAAPLPTALPIPLERLRLPPALSGAAGSNRAPDRATGIAAGDDLAAVTAWLARYADSAATLTAYRREVERLILWSVLQLGKPLSSLTHEDLLAYERFLADPQPAARWVLAGSKKLARSHPDWRPFAGPLAPRSIRQALVILNALFAWLTEASYLAGNPLALARRRRAPTRPRIKRYLSHELWDVVKATIEAMPGTADTATERERLHAARCRWLLTVLYLGGLRAAEVTGTTMGAFFCRRDTQGIERWWLEVTGKGNKTRLVPATDELIAELARYRRAHGLAPTPQPGETRPLLLPVIGQENRERGLSRSALHLILKEVFGLAAASLRARGPEWAAQADVLASASAHWLRHTAGSHMTDRQVDLRYVRDNFGHASISTTSGYLHSEDDARHEATQVRHRIGWTSKT